MPAQPCQPFRRSTRAFNKLTQANPIRATLRHFLRPPQMKHTADTAALRVQVVNGSFVLEERLWAAADCGVFQQLAE